MLKEDDEWGPVVIHDGKGCPIPVGTLVRIKFFDKDAPITGLVVGNKGGSWIWGDPKDKATWSKSVDGKLCLPVIEYQLKKPLRTEKGMSILKSILDQVGQNNRQRILDPVS